MDIEVAFFVTTYNRPQACKKLIREIAPFGDIYLLNDGSDKEYKLEKTLLQGHEIYFVTQLHKGKRHYWQTVNSLWILPNKVYDYYFMIPDDFLPVDDFLKKALSTWVKISDPRKICLNTYVDQARLNKPCWTGIIPREIDDYRLTGWVDMCFMCEYNFFRSVGRIPEINLNWDKKPETSSGVGAHISKLLNRKGYTMYQTKKSLFTTQPEALTSQMNPWREDDLIHKAVI